MKPGSLQKNSPNCFGNIFTDPLKLLYLLKPTNMKKSYATTVVSIVLFCGSLQAQVVPKNWNCHKDDEFRISICFPNEWRYDDTTKGARFFIFSPSEGKDDRFSQNFNLQASKMDDITLSLREYVNLNTSEIKKGIKNFEQLGARYLTLNGVQWYEFIYQGNIDEVNYKLKFLQRFAVYKGNAFVITYSSVGDMPDAFNTTALKILNTVTL
jgi:hypothetical protein